MEVFDELPFWMNNAGVINRTRQGIYCYDRAGGETAALTREEFDVELVSVEGDLILYTGCLHLGRRPDASEVRLYDLAAGTDRQLLAPGKYDFSYAGLWNGAAIMAAVPDSRLSARTDYDFYRIGLEDGEVSLFARYGNTCCVGGGVSSDAQLGSFSAVVPDGDSLCFMSNLAGDACVCRLDNDGHIEERLTSGGSCDSFDIRNGRLVVCGMYHDRICELYENGVRLTHFNDAFFETHTVSSPEVHRFVDDDGYEIHGWCIKPADYEPGKKYPAILQIHGGPRIIFGNVFYHEMQVMAASG